MNRVVGNRRSEEELKNITIQQNKESYILDDQDNFKGSKEELEMMQNFERAYIDGRPLISDEEWDILKYKYNYQESLVAGSPSGRQWVKLEAPLPSINKAASIDDLKLYFSRFDDGQEFQVECKLDGLTANMHYIFDPYNYVYKFDYISSRGNGRYGLKLNRNALTGVKTNIPKTIPASIICDIINEYDPDSKIPASIEIRGEAVIPINDYTIAKYGETPVWRNIASGIFNRKIPANLNGLHEIYGPRCDLTEDYIEIEDKEIAKLYASLVDAPYSIRAKDKVFINHNSIKIKHNDGNEDINQFVDEYLDIVTYSITINGSNIDIPSLKNIPGIKYISDIQFRDGVNQDPVFMISDDPDKIWTDVCRFYGCNNNAERDYSMPRLRNLHEYALDGIVIKPVGSNNDTQGMSIRNNKNNPNKIVVPKYPEDQIAVKLLSERVKVHLDKIESTTTKLGNVTLSGLLDKPYLTESGAMVQSINLHNPEWLEANSWIREGNDYYLVMAMDIIPQLMPIDF